MSDNQLPVSAQNKEVRQWAMLCHFAAFLGLVFPFGSVLGPLILWQVKKDMDPLIDDQGKEALNFQLTVAIAWLVCFVLGFVVIGFLLMVVLVIAGRAGVPSAPGATDARVAGAKVQSACCPRRNGSSARRREWPRRGKSGDSHSIRRSAWKKSYSQGSWCIASRVLTGSDDVRAWLSIA